MSEDLKTKSGDFFKELIDAKLKANRQLRGKPVEPVSSGTLDYAEMRKGKNIGVEGDTLDYGKLRKEYANKAKNAGVPSGSLRQGLKPLAKGLKALPIIGTIAALASSEDASAAIPGLDSAESAGMSGADENMMMAEIQGRKDYGESQAAEDVKRNKMAILAKLAELKGNE